MMKVFLVDDEIAIRENLRNSFPWEEKGYQLVGEAPDGEMALPMLRDLNADILLTDIRMPFMDGMKLCEEVQERPAVRKRSEGPGPGDDRSTEGSGQAECPRRTGKGNHSGALGKGAGDRGGTV